jgi:hypothetical protein
MVDVVKRWYAEITDLRQKYPLLIVMRDYEGENMQHNINDFFSENSVKNH